MSDSDPPAARPVLSVACPGGMARQFRVQVPDAAMPSQWRLVGCFRQAESANACAKGLAESGTPARVVECRSLPTAA